MDLTFRIDTREEHVEIKDDNVLAVLAPASLPEGLDQEAILNDALDHPTGTNRLESIVKPQDTVAIITSDITRPMPSYTVLPPVLKRLEQVGVPNENITIVIALGSHRRQTEEELRHLVGGKVFEEYRVLNSGENGFIRAGITKAGTPVDIDTNVMKADRRICLGNVEFHYFAGFSGGAKAIMPGCSTPDAIAKNHRFMTDDNAHAGKLDGNPVREDLEEGAAMVGSDFIVNVVLNTKKEVIYAAAGDLRKAHRDACKHLSDLYLSPIPEKADIVIVSQAGAPKDLNLYQTQKALDNAKHAVKDGGIIILIGSCKEGFGNQNFETWMKRYRKPKDMIQALQEHFVLGGHKAAAIAKVEEKAEILLVSDLPDEEVSDTFLKPFHSVEEAYIYAQEHLGNNASVIAMPYGGSTLPVVQK
jgi:nickel-dependent lactate racemase